MDKLHENLKTLHRQLRSDEAEGNPEAKAFTDTLGGELRAAQRSLDMPKGYLIQSCDEEPDYRYRLEVSTSTIRSDRLVVIQLNPSTANSSRSDPTIGKVSTWARDTFGHVTFLNLFALRTPHPDNLRGLPLDALVGRRNEAVTQSALREASTVILAWGRIHRTLLHNYYQRLTTLKHLLRDREVFAVGAPAAGTFPRHGRIWNGENRQMRIFDLNTHLTEIHLRLPGSPNPSGRSRPL